MNDIILVGAGGHTRACVDVIEVEGRFHIAGLIEKEKSADEESLGIPIIGTDQDLENLRGKFNNAFITVGQIKSAEIRIRLFNILKKLNYILPVIMSTKAYISQNATIGEGTIVMHGAIVNANAIIGRNCIINNGALVEHDAVVGDHCHISTGAIINGGVSVGEGSFIGSGVITKQGIVINNHCIIGAGVVLKHDVDSNQMVKN